MPAVTVMAVSLAWLVLPIAVTDDLVEEGGLVENITIACYGLALLALGLHRSAAADKRTWAATLVVALAFAGRELDQHLVWTGFSVLKGSFYLGEAPAVHKLVGSLAVTAFIAALAFLTVKHGRSTLVALKKGDPLAATVAVFIATLVLSKLLDRSVSILIWDAGVSVAPAVQVLVRAIEETLELTLPLLFLLGWLQQRPRCPPEDSGSPKAL